MTLMTPPVLTCGSCGAGVPLGRHPLVCSQCGFAFKRVEGNVIDLRDDVGFDTLLDVDAYDDAHNVHQQSKTLARTYERMLQERGFTHFEHLLEIGAGSGNLTSGLVETSCFETIHASELSPAFIRLLQQRLSGTPPEKLNLFLLDANTNPFQDGSFDCVVGHSILHHLARFEHTIAECCRVTRAGGACVFGEPVLDIHVFPALAAKLILSLTDAKLPERTRIVLAFLAKRPQIKRDNLNGDRDALQNIEDKFIFAIDDMRRLAEDIGFSDFDCVCPRNQMTLGEAALTILRRTLKREQQDTAFLEDYQFIFDSFSEQVGAPMNQNGMAPFAYFVFTK